MAKRKLYTVDFRRRRSGKTDYRRRLKMLLSGQPRLIIRKSLKGITVQVGEYDEKGDKIICSVSSRHLVKYGWKVGFSNLPSAYLTGLLIGKVVGEKKISEVVVDIGMHKSVKGAKVYAVVKGVQDAGIAIRCADDVFPAEDRLSGKHIQSYAQALSKDSEQYKKVFSDYLKNDFDPLKITENFTSVKNKILGEA